jgi:hypothetical protein
MAINFNNRNQGIGALNLGDFGLQQPEENMTVAEAINFGTLPQAQEKFEPDFGGMLDATRTLGKSYKGTTKGDFIDAIEAGAFGPGSGQMFDRNIGDVFEGIDLGKAGMFSFGDVAPTLKGTSDGTFRNTLDIDRGALSPEALESLPQGFFKSVGDQSSLGLPTNDKLAMAISNYDDLFGPRTMTDANQGLYTGMMDAKSGVPVGTSVGITDKNRGMPGAPTGAFEMIGGTPVAVGDVLGRQMALEKADFYEEPSNKKGLASFFGKMLGPALTLAGFPTPGKLVSAYNTVRSLQDGSLNKAVNTARTGIGSLGSRIAGKMRGINPNTGRANTQAEYEANRANRSLAKRQANMIARKNANKSYSAKNLAEVTRELNRQNTAREKAKTQKSQNPNLRSGANSGGGGRSKIVCTMMNDRYGFGSFRNKIWMKFHESYGPEYQKGYHAIFLPLVKIAKGEGKINTAVRKVLEHMGRHVTADMFKIMKGKKRDTLGRIYRAIFEPACHIIGKIKSALGRG